MKKLLIAGVFAIAAALAVYGVAKSTYVPAESVRLAQEFIVLVGEEKFDAAFAMTSGYGLPAFTAAAKHELGLVPGHGPRAGKFDHAFPRQSYGNRLRRWFSGEPLDQEEVLVDFWLMENGKSVGPFSVKFRRQGEAWKIVHFQIHAA